MKPFLEFLKFSILGGLMVILPLMLFGMLMSELFDLATVLATPIADIVFGKQQLDPAYPTVFAIVLIVGASFFVGLLVRIAFLRTGGGWIEQKILMPLPGYRAIKSLIHGLFGNSSADGFTPVVYRSSENEKQIAYLVEELGDDEVVIMIPFSPTPMAGNLKIVANDRIELIPGSLVDVTAVLSYWGKGTRAIIQGKSFGEAR